MKAGNCPKIRQRSITTPCSSDSMNRRCPSCPQAWTLHSGQKLPGQCGGLRSPVQFSLDWNQRPSLCIRSPIDLLAFLTLYPEDWQRHSYAALCGTAEHAMLWMLGKNPNLQKVILCLDHDAAGIEAVGRLTDILREHGYTQIAPLRSVYKDWDEDLKARCGLGGAAPRSIRSLRWRGSSAGESEPGARKFSRIGRFISSPDCSCGTGTTSIGDTLTRRWSAWKPWRRCPSRWCCGSANRWVPR